MKKPNIFISYAKEDKATADQLFSALEAEKCNPWLDTEKLLPGQTWKVEIRRAIKESSFFLALLSKNSVNKKGYFQKELLEGISVLEETPNSEIYFIPVRIDECEPRHPILNDIHWVDIFPDFRSGLISILSAVYGRTYTNILTNGVNSVFYVLHIDKPGALSSIADAFSKLDISIEALMQREPNPLMRNGYVEMYIEIAHSENFNVDDFRGLFSTVEGLGAVLLVNEKNFHWII